MRDFQTKQNKSGLPDSINVERFGAGEFNALAVEAKQAVSSSDQTLAPADGTGEVTDQLTKAMSIYGAGGAGHYLDAGVADAYVLTIVSPKKSPPSYFNGFTVAFKPGNINTGPSTVNIAGIGVKNITTVLGAALIGGELSGIVFIKYNLSSDRVELIGRLAEDMFFDDSTTTITATEVQAAIVALDALVSSFSPFYDAYLKYSDVKTSGADGGTFTLGAWQTRVLNTEDDDTAGIGSLSSNKITLPAGQYIVKASCIAYRVNQNKVKLRDTFNGVDLLIGASEHADSAFDGSSRSTVNGLITVASDTTLELQHRSASTQAANGLGNSSGFGVDEVYSIIEFWRLT